MPILDRPARVGPPPSRVSFRPKDPNALYYDTGRVTAAQASHVSSMPRGAVLVVTADKVLTGEAADAYLAEHPKTPVTLAGVGSTGVGTLALATHVSDVMGRDVAGIVAGNGVMKDGPEGYFVARDALKAGESYDGYMGKVVAQLTNVMDPIHWPINFLKKSRLLMDYAIYHGDQEVSATVHKLSGLLLNGFTPDYIVGHSKGAMDALAALHEVASKIQGPLQGQKLITLGMVVDHAPEGVKMAQYLGSADTLGRSNSLKLSGPDVVSVEGAMHSTSTDASVAPFALPLEKILPHAQDWLNNTR